MNSEIKRILASFAVGDFYDILSLEEDCHQDEIKKAYRRLALLFHPDKSTEEGTVEAFKCISNAFTLLNDVDKRRNFDLNGLNQPQHHHYEDDDEDYQQEDEFETFFRFFGGINI